MHYIYYISSLIDMIRIFFKNVPLPGGKDEATHRGGEDAGPGGGADAADHAAGAGDHPQGEGAGSQGEETCRGGEVPPGETGRGSAVSCKAPSEL